jgi:hypothetical protein
MERREGELQSSKGEERRGAVVVTRGDKYLVTELVLIHTADDSSRFIQE